MWVQGDEDYPASESDGESGLSSEDEGQIQCEMLEKQRDEANHKLYTLEEVSNQLLKEMNLLEIQFEIERSCRESAEALAVKVTNENKALKRRSQMLMPLIPELPENLADVTFDPGCEVESGDVCDAGGLDGLLLQSQAKITALQATVDGLLSEKLQLENQVELLIKEQVQLREQLALEVEEKEAIVKKMSKQSKAMNKIKQVSHLVTEEFTEMSQKLELEQGLRQHAEVWASQMLEAQRRTVIPATTSETSVHLQQALEQISHISHVLRDIQHQQQSNQNQDDTEEKSLQCELQSLKETLKTCEDEKKALETQLTEANSRVRLLQQEVKQLQDSQKETETRDEPEEEKPGVSLPPPPPPPPPPTAPVVNSLEFLKQRRKEAASKGDAKKESPFADLKSKAVDEMMERIKKGVVLRPTATEQDNDSSWKDQRNENRKSAITELNGVLNNIKLKNRRRLSSRRGIGKNVGEAELLSVLQRRRRAMGDSSDPVASSQGQGLTCAVSNQDLPWAGESGDAPVLRRLKQNREHRNSRIQASSFVINPEKSLR